MKLRFKTLCACLALVMYAENLMADEKDFQSTSSQSQKESTDSRGRKREMPQKVLHRWMTAANEGDIETIHSYIDQHYDVNDKDRDGNTALLLATYQGFPEIVKLLLAKGADVNAKNKYGDTALMLAVANGDTEISKLLLEHIGGNPNDEVIAFLLSEKNKIKRNDEWISQKSKSLGKKQANINDQNNNGKTALMYAAENGLTETAKLLLEHGANINAQDNRGATALMYAAEKGWTKTVKLLLDHGADVNTKDKEGLTVLMYAAENGRTKTVKFLLKYWGADVNAKDNSGKTALMYVAENGHSELVKLLWENGADIGILDNRKWQALNYAMDKLEKLDNTKLERHNYELIEEYLKNSDLRVNSSRYKKTEMPPEVLREWMEAAKEGDIDTIRSYIEQNYDIDTIDENGDTAFGIALERKDSKMTGLLMSRGADISEHV